MSFATRKAFQEAIDNADRAFQRGTNDGNLIDVIKEFHPELTKIFKAGQDKALKPEMDVPRFLWHCCAAYKTALKAGDMDNEKWVNQQRKALARFKKEEKERNSGAAAMPPTQPAAGPSTNVVPPPIPLATRPRTPIPAVPVQDPPMARAEPKVMPLSSAPAKLTKQPTTLPAPSTSAARPTPAAPLKKPKMPNAPKKVVPIKTHRPVAPRREGPPTDEMARLTMAEKQDRGDAVRVSRPARRLGSIEEMDVDEGSRGSKRKRDDSRDPEYIGSDAEEDEEENEEEKAAPGRAKPQAEGKQKRMAKRGGTFRNPPCSHCRRFGFKCEDQLEKLSYRSACCACYEAKRACREGGRAAAEGTTAAAPRKRSRRQPPPERVVESEDSASEKAKEDRRELGDEEQAGRRADKSRIRELEARLAKVERERKGKGRATREHEQEWEEEDWAERLMELEERVGNRVDDLEERLARLEREMGRMQSMKTRLTELEHHFGKAEEGLGWIEDRQNDLEARMDIMENPLGHRGRRQVGSPGSTSGLSSAPASQSASPTVPTRSPSPTAPTRSPSVSASGSGSRGPTWMDLPPTATQTEMAPVVDNVTSGSTQGRCSLPRVNVIPATPQSSEEQGKSQVPPPSPSATTVNGPAPTTSLVVLPPTPSATVSTPMSAPRWERIVPPPPWQQSVPLEEASGPPPASNSLLAPPVPDTGHPKSPRRARSRTPSPGPTRRSPRLQSPIPNMTATSAAPSGEGHSTSMEIDK